MPWVALDDEGRLPVRQTLLFPETRELVDVHRTYLLFVYKWAAISSLVGSIAFVVTVASPGEPIAYPRWLALFVPAMSAPIKLLLKRYGVGGLVLCGGLTNLWNLLFFACANASIIAAE